MTVDIIKYLFSAYVGVWLGMNDIYPFDATWFKWWTIMLPLSIIL